MRIDLINGSVTDWLATPGHEGYGRLSPDGQWLAYESNRTGRREVFLRGIAGGPEIQLTTDGGTFPSWRPDGQAVFAISRQRLVRIPLAHGRPGAVELVRSDPTVVLASPRGQQLVAVITIEESRPLTTLHVVGNWLSEVRAQLPR